MKPLAYNGAGGLDVVGGGGGELVQGQLLLNVRHRQGSGQVLLVGDDQQRGALVLCKLGDFVKLSLGLLQPVHVHRVHNINDPIRTPAVGLPQGSQLLLPPHVPEVTADALGRAVAQPDLLRVEADRGDRVDKLVEFESVKDRGFPSRVQTQHDDVERLEGRDVGEAVPHFDLFWFFRLTLPKLEIQGPTAQLINGQIPLVEHRWGVGGFRPWFTLFD